MLAWLLFFWASFFVVTKAQKHPEFPQWNAVHWVVQNVGDVITLPCFDQSFYPFNNLDSIVKVNWITPESSAYLHLSPGESKEGWTVNNKESYYALSINKKGMNVPEAVVGMYVCAALAKLPENDTLYAWYYLRWGLGLYANVPAMNPGGIERYNGKFIIAGVALSVYVVLVIGFFLVCNFRYKGGPIENDESVDGEEGYEMDKYDADVNFSGTKDDASVVF
uniref:Ig-like domain-containing protein n=1 Tax=Schistocephalus solidus TaxID=70667 RepID=A0A0X3PNX5_SCHSO